MLYVHLLILVFITLHQSPVLVRAAPGSACSSGIYQAFLPLSNYPPAESFCSTHYPQPVVTLTVTAPGSSHKYKRTPNSTPRPPTSPYYTSTSTNTSHSSSINGQDQLWASLEYAAASFVSTVCSCIITPSTTTVRLD